MKLLEELSQVSFEGILNGTAEQIADSLDQTLGEIRDKLLEEKTIKRRKGDAVYPTYILQMKNKLKNMHKRAKKMKNLILMNRCRFFEKKIRKEVSSNMKSRIRIEANLGPNNLWKAVNIALNKITNTMPDIMTEDALEIKEDKLKAGAFADYFEKKVLDTVHSTHADGAVYNGKRKIFGIHDDDWINEEIVASVIDSFDQKRCEGYDRIPLQFLIDGKEELLTVITLLMKKIMNTGKVPDQWKIAKVKPLHKKGSKKSISNYRPISNLSSITKIFERLVLGRIGVIEQREKCSLTGRSQHGFKKNCSTETACLQIQSMIASQCDIGNYVTVTSLDLTAAFDVVDTELLIKRLKIMGMPVQLIQVIQNWLSERYFYCDINGKSSSIRKLTRGTVQGSILGPLLFALFISPMEDLIQALVNFADDNYNISSANTELESIRKCVEQSTIMVEWLSASGLCVNKEKTEICVFSRFRCTVTDTMLQGQKISIKKDMRVLGVIFDCKLTWYAQVAKAISSANKAKQGLSLIAKYFTSEELLKLATAYFYSRLYYGAGVWLITTLTANLKKKLWQSSSRMLRIIDKDYERLNSFRSLHLKYKRASPEQWGNYTTAVALYRIITSQSQDSLVNAITLNVLHNERREGMLLTRSNNTKMGYNCLSNRLQFVTNKLHGNWMDMTTSQFRMLCKKTFIVV